METCFAKVKRNFADLQPSQWGSNSKGKKQITLAPACQNTALQGWDTVSVADVVIS